MFFDTMFFENICEDVDLEFYEWILWVYKEPPIIARSYTSAIEEIKKTLKSMEHCDIGSLQKEIGLPPFQDKQTKSNILKSLNERLKELKIIRRNYLNSLSPIGKKISKNSASTGLSNTKRDKLLCLLLIDLVEQIPDDMILLSDEADEGFLKLTEPVIRRKNQNF